MCAAALACARAVLGCGMVSGARSRCAPERERWSARFARCLSCCLAAGLLLGCGAPSKFVFHAAGGQLDLYRSARPIKKVVSDERTPEPIRQLLSEVPRIKAFALDRGLAISDNYEEFVALDRPYVVWFVNASHPLAFSPKTFWFPVVGSFPGLGWFDEESARRHAASLEREGWDVSMRGVRAFSTGGWFADPIVSSMFTESDNAFGYLVNVILHESLHATVLVANQQYYNESLASFVGDEMTLSYLRRRFGQDSAELGVYLERTEQAAEAEALLASRYQALEALYNSDKPPRQKLIEKQKVMRELYVRLGFEELPTNATLIGTRLYDVGQAEFGELLSACDHDWPRFVRVTGSVRDRHFATQQQEDFVPLVRTMIERGCKPFGPSRPTRYRMR